MLVTVYIGYAGLGSMCVTETRLSMPILGCPRPACPRPACARQGLSQAVPVQTCTRLHTAIRQLWSFLPGLVCVMRLPMKLVWASGRLFLETRHAVDPSSTPQVSHVNSTAVASCTI